MIHLPAKIYSDLGKAKMAPRVGRRDHVLDSDISFDLQRLFDPYNFDHIPVEKRLALFKQRDLPHVKHYKAAVKIFGGPQKRTRALVAPPMETPLKHRLGLYMNRTEQPPPPILNGALRPQVELVTEPTTEEKEKMEGEEKILKYKSWINQRKMLRGDLDNLGINEGMLARKPDKSELEKRVQAKFKRDRLWKPETPPPVEVTPPPVPPPDIPSVDVPAPDGLQILDKFLSLNRMRLMDLFKLADKDKSWSLSREEFLNAVSQCEIPISESDVDDMIITLDADLDEELNYQELNKGLNEWRKQRRNMKKEGIEEPVRAMSASLKGKRSEASVSQESKLKETADVNNSKIPSSTCHESREKIGTAERSSKSTPSQTPREKISRESKTLKSRENATQESHRSSKHGSQVVEFVQTREKSNVSSSKVSSREGRLLTANISENVTNAEDSLPSQPVLLLSREANSVLKTSTSSHGNLPLDVEADRSIYEDVLFPAEDTLRAPVTAQEVGEVKERVKESRESKRPSSSAKSSSHSGSHSRSRSSTPNTLEPPEFDVRAETRVPESLEAMVDIRKHDRVVLSRNNIKRSLSREQRVMFDEIPGVIKVGYKPIDNHCSESTLGGEVAGLVNQFRREKLKEYFEVKKLCDEQGLPFSQRTLDRVLLYPGDKPTSQLKKNITLPLGPLTNEISPFNQPKPKKRSKKQRKGMTRLSRASNISGGGRVRKSESLKNTSDGYQDDERSGSGSSKRSYLTVEDVYPFAASVIPKVYKENLSSGRALITRKVDNWMTFEEYCKYTENLPNRFHHLNRRSNPDAAWPGYVLDKLRLCMTPDGRDKRHAVVNRDSVAYEGLGTGLYNGQGHAVFRNIQQSKRAYPGYNNDLLTWPVGENGVRYANIDEHRLVK